MEVGFLWWGLLLEVVVVLEVYDNVYKNLFGEQVFENSLVFVFLVFRFLNLLLEIVVSIEVYSKMFRC